MTAKTSRTTSGGRRTASSPTYVLPLSECAGVGVDLVGGKAIGLGELIKLDLPVPQGFAITTDAFRAAIDAAGIAEELAGVGTAADGYGENNDLAKAAQSLFTDLELPEELANQISTAYLDLGDGARVAVRSSATAEDTAEASFAGQQDTYLWISGVEDLLRHVVRCWASLFTPQAIAYRARFAVPTDELAMGVVVQTMVPAHAAGVLMSIEPVTGDPSIIYIETALGVGEGVVRGDVPVDRVWMDKVSLDVRQAQIAVKDKAHMFDAAAGEGLVAAVAEEVRDKPALSDAQLRALGRLAVQVEEAFGCPMDVEWAVADGVADHDGVLLLQARPETVWSNRAEPATTWYPTEEWTESFDDWDPLHDRSAAHLHWSTDNLGEAAPGVLSPLGWSLWSRVGEGAAREALYRMGALNAGERLAPDAPEDRILRAFFGRVAMQVELLATVGNRMPGTTGQEVVRGIFGRVPDDIDYTATRQQYLAVLGRAPVATLLTPGRVRRLADNTDAWWRDSTAALTTANLDEARSTFRSAAEQFDTTLTLHTLCLMGVVQPMFDSLTKLVEKTGAGDVALLSGSGGAEIAVVSDIWAASRGQMTVADVAANHGFHGPGEGELSSTVWREDHSPLERLVTEYRRRPDDGDPRHVEDRRAAAARRSREELLQATPRHKRAAVSLMLAMAAARIPLRGVGKRSFLQAFDVARASARCIGQHLERDGVLAKADDVFFLTIDEITGDLPADVRSLVERRRERREAYKRLVVPSYWKGQPQPLSDQDLAASGDVVTGIGVSNGVIEGTVRVVETPDFSEVKADEILVAPTTDPSWSSIMFVSSALVVDIGGALSHAAVVARELGLPCVVNTRTGTRVLKTGDRVRVDGRAGTVTIVERAK